MLEFFVDNFSCAWAVFFVALLPMFENRVAIPLGLSSEIWGGEILAPLQTFLITLSASALASLGIIWFVKLLKKKTAGFVFDKFYIKIEQRFRLKVDDIVQKKSTLKKCIALALFVAVPLPLTGAYSGSLIGGFLNIKWWQAFLSVFVGQIFSCLTLLILSTLFNNSAIYVLIASLIMILAFLLLNFSIRIFHRIKKEKR